MEGILDGFDARAKWLCKYVNNAKRAGESGQNFVQGLQFKDSHEFHNPCIWICPINMFRELKGHHARKLYPHQQPD